jgi:hypothetical protein
MKIAMETPLRVGDTFVAVLACHEIEATSSFGFLSFSGGKVPLAVILRKADDIIAYHPDGRSMDLTELKLLCQGTQDAMQAISDFGSYRR